MVRDTTPHRSRLTIGTAIVLLSSACASSRLPPRAPTPPPSRVSLGHFAAPFESGYPEEYPVAEVHAAKATDILADDPAMAPMRPNPPLPEPEGNKEFKRRYFPEESKPPPVQAPTPIAPPLSQPIMDTRPIPPAPVLEPPPSQ